MPLLALAAVDTRSRNVLAPRKLYVLQGEEREPSAVHQQL